MAQQPDDSQTQDNARKWKKLVVLSVVTVVVLVATTRYRDALSLEGFAQHESQLRVFQRQHPALVYGAAFLVYAVATGLSLPGATVLTLIYGWYFGIIRGVILVSFASTAGATLAFLLSRFLLRDAIQQRFGDRLEKFNAALEREGPYYLFTLRLIPAVPFFVINAVMGLTPIRTRTFWWVSQIGMLAGTIVYVYAGSSVPGLQTLAEKGVYAAFTPGQLWQIITAFVLLGLFPLAVRWAMKLYSGVNAKPIDDSRPTDADLQ